MELEQARPRGMSRDAIKYIAMVTMLLNHFANVFLQPDTILHRIFVNVGYFTAPVMCYFLVEGYHHTRSRRRYAQRLFLFAALSQLPYGMALASRGFWQFTGCNMLFSLFFCLLLIVVWEQMLPGLGKVLAVVGIFVVSLFCDWGALAPVFTLLFLWARGDKRNVLLAFSVASLLFGIDIFGAWFGYCSLGQNLLYCAAGMAAVALAGVCIVFFYNGRRMTRGQTFSKWFFYLFYPAHLLVLGIVRIALSS